MFKITKTILSWSLIAISSITFINISILYWIPIKIPLSSYSAFGLMFVAFAEKAYFLIIISFLICVLLFISACAIQKQQIIVPSFLFVYLLCESSRVIYLFVDELYANKYFMPTYFWYVIQCLILIVFMGIYFFLRWKHKNVSVK